MNEEKRSCNRHDDCDLADRRFKEQYPKGKYIGNGITVDRVDHCHDECCEECFGS